MKRFSMKRVILLSAAAAGVFCAAIFNTHPTNAAEEGISKMNAVLQPVKPPPQLDAEIPKNLQTATFALG